jgi:hypothetical protein
VRQLPRINFVLEQLSYRSATLQNLTFDQNSLAKIAAARKFGQLSSLC